MRLKRRVRLARGPHPIHDIMPGDIGLHHFPDGVDVILQVGINTDNGIGIVGIGQTCQQRGLMALVT